MLADGVNDSKENFDLLRSQNIEVSIKLKKDAAAMFNGSHARWPAWSSVRSSANTVGSHDTNTSVGGE